MIKPTYVYELCAFTGGIPGHLHSQTVAARSRETYSCAEWTAVDAGCSVFAFPVALVAAAAIALRRPFSPSAVACGAQTG